MIKLIFLGILIYFIYKTIKYLTRLVSAAEEKKNDHVNKAETKSRLNIDQKDIIEAKFQEIKPEEEEKEKKKPENE